MTRDTSAILITLGLRLSVVAVVGFLLLPGVIVTIAAFDSRAILSFPPQGFSLRWFERALTYRDFVNGIKNGAIIMVVSSCLALAIGTAFAYAIERYDFAGKKTIEGFLLAPLVVPHFVVGLGFLMFASQLGLARTYTVVVICHLVLVMPFVLRSVYISLKNLDPRLERAAASLGASPGRVLFTVTLPLLMPGLVSGWMFAAILSFNEFTASLFVTAQRTQTLPVAMYNYVREYADPTMAALSAIFIVLTAAVLVLADRFLGLGKVLNVDEAHD
jgi:putative spermidine/putrescine transport system permease protein